MPFFATKKNFFTLSLILINFFSVSISYAQNATEIPSQKTQIVNTSINNDSSANLSKEYFLKNYSPEAQEKLAPLVENLEKVVYKFLFAIKDYSDPAALSEAFVKQDSESAVKEIANASIGYLWSNYKILIITIITIIATFLLTFLASYVLSIILVFKKAPKSKKIANFWKRITVLSVEFLCVISIGIVFNSFFSEGSVSDIVTIVFFLINIFLYFFMGKSIGDFVTKTRLVRKGTDKTPGFGRLLSRWLLKLVWGSPFLISLVIVAVMIMQSVSFETPSDIINLIPNALIYLYIIGSGIVLSIILIFLASVWIHVGKTQQAWHDKVTDIEYKEEISYSGAYNFFINIPFVINTILGYIVIAIIFILLNNLLIS